VSTGLQTDGDVRRNDTKRYLTTPEVGELLRVPAETVRYWRHLGTGPKSFKVGRRVLYASEDVDAFIAEARSSVSGAA
jgi:hypothetical protein